MRSTLTRVLVAGGAVLALGAGLALTATAPSAVASTAKVAAVAKPAKPAAPSCTTDSYTLNSPSPVTAAWYDGSIDRMYASKTQNPDYICGIDNGNTFVNQQLENLGPDGDSLTGNCWQYVGSPPGGYITLATCAPSKTAQRWTETSSLYWQNGDEGSGWDLYTSCATCQLNLEGPSVKWELVG